MSVAYSQAFLQQGDQDEAEGGGERSNFIQAGQIIATSHEMGPQKVAEEGKSSAISGKSRLVKYYSIAPNHLMFDWPPVDCICA